MKVLPANAHNMMGRFAPDAVPIQCDCGIQLLWERRMGETVTCPSCKRSEVVALDGDVTKDPALKVPADQLFSDASLSVSAPVTAAPEPIILTDKPLPTSHIQGLAQFDRTIAVAVVDTNKEFEMKEVMLLPEALSGMLADLKKSAVAAGARLAKAKDRHSGVVDRIHGIAAAVEKAADQSEDVINQMMGGNGPPLGGSTN